MPIRTVAICAGSGGSMLLGQEADVYLTGEMTHVRISFFFFFFPVRDDINSNVRDH